MEQQHRQPSVHNKNSFDVIVLGVGSMGSSACYYLAQRGYNVLGIDQFHIPHERGSHTGQSRIIRKAYYEHPDYVPLLQKAYNNWKSLEAMAGTQLYYPTGLLYMAPPESKLIKGIRTSAAAYNIPLENVGHNEDKETFHQFHLPENYVKILEQDAGFVLVEKTILAYYEAAIRCGATIKTAEKILNWTDKGNDIHVKTSKAVYTTKKLVITAGPWTPELIPLLKEKLQVTLQLMAWVKPKRWEPFTMGNLPCWFITDENFPGFFYGFPALPAAKYHNPPGIKIAHHYTGSQVTPEDKDNFAFAEEVQKLRYILDKYMPDAFEEIVDIKSCLYTNSPEGNFIIDLLPQHDGRIAIAGAFSGHGFKFVPIVGEILADLATEGKTELPIGFLNVQSVL